ncbi:VWA domain-containing protein [Litchfieldia alkalitelluris]|uniref:VWA domain-containing protein n=1 Tax=Litchfieldia alkalitelluris TaxID=304268 RepID=UPI000996DDC3|nr:VWA domain-containing protein [Litchfieldia alkalitelluris]
MKRCLSHSLILVLTLFFIFGQQVNIFAEDSSEELVVEISTDKDTYEIGENIEYTIKVANQSELIAKDLVVTTTLPEGLEVTSTEAEKEKNQLSWNVEKISPKSDTSLTFQAIAKETGKPTPPDETDVKEPGDDPKKDQDDKPEEDPPQSEDKEDEVTTGGSKPTPTGSSPQTGDNTSITTFVVILIGAMSVLIASFIILYKKRNKNVVTFILIASLITPSFTGMARAEENENENEPTKSVVEATHTLMINEKEYEIVTTVEGVLEVDPETLDNSVTITSHVEEEIEVDTDSITLKGKSTGKDIQTLYYSVFDESDNVPERIPVAGLRDWEINIALTPGIHRIVVFGEDLEGNVIGDEMTVSYKNDEDADELPYSMEIELKTSPTNPDSDEDKLPDGYEYLILGTDPAKADTDENGVSDADEDADQDGLTNLEEMELGLDPLNPDSDHDGLSDGEEVNTHNTDPLKEDTDEDGLSDEDELILGFDPLKKDTDGNGIIDSEEVLEQPLNEETMSEVVKEDSPIIPSITIKGSGNLNDSVIVTDQEDHVVMNTIPGLVGDPIDIKSLTDFEEATISFSLKEGVPADRNLEDYVVAWFDDEQNKLVPLESSYTPETNTISAKTDHFSYYLLLDAVTLRKETDAGNVEDKIEKGKADVAFVIDSTGSMGGTINNVKSNINSFVDRLDANKVDVRLGLVDYKDIDADGPESTVNHGWFEDPTSFRNKLNRVYANGGGDDPESAVDALEEGRLMGFQENKAKFMILVTDIDYHEKTRFEGLDSMGEIINRLETDKIVTSVVAPDYYKETYRELFERTGGIFADIYGNFSTELDKLIENIGEETNDKVTIRLSTHELVRLDKYPDPTDKITDTDGDLKPDSEELTEKISCELPDFTIVECWKFESHPGLAHSDNDVYDDNEDLQPTVAYQPSIFFLHGWTSDTKKTFGVRNNIINNNHEDSDLENNPDYIGQYTNISNQKVNGKGDKNHLYNDVLKKYGSYAKTFAFNYPNLADPKTSAVLFETYLENLIDAGELTSPTADTKPSVTLIAHSMGGLVSRHFTEKLGQNTVDVDGIITLGTPHWGATALSKHCINFPDAGMCRMSGKSKKQLSSPGAKALDPAPTKNFGFTRVPSWTEILNDGFSKGSTKYFAVGGVSIWGDTSLFEAIDVRYIETAAGPDFEDLAYKRVDEHGRWKYLLPSYYNDDVVSLNSALGSQKNIKGAESETVLNFNDRYVVIGPSDDANHGNLVNFSHTTNTVNYWLKHHIINQHLNAETMNKFKVSEPSHLHHTY